MSRLWLLIGLYIIGVQLALTAADETEQPTTEVSGLEEAEDVNLTLMKSASVLSEVPEIYQSELNSYAGDADEFNNLRQITEIVHMLKHSNDDKSLPRDCDEAMQARQISGVYKMYIPESGMPPFFAYCRAAAETNWMIIQRRMNGLVDFSRNWEYYKNGFGDLNGEYWLGLDLIHAITDSAKHEIWFELQDHQGNRKYARYDNFLVSDESTNYTLQAVGNYIGNAGDSFRYQVGNQYSTKDADNDSKHDGNCAQLLSGGWWFGNCRECHLNGLYKDEKNAKTQFGIGWYGWHGKDYSLKYVHMAIRPVKSSVKNCKSVKSARYSE